MSSGQKQCWEDEEDWAFLKKTAGIQDVRWDVYSNEATLARQGVRQGFSGIRLKTYVRHEIEKQELARRQKAELDELSMLAKLQEKYQ